MASGERAIQGNTRAAGGEGSFILFNCFKWQCSWALKWDGVSGKRKGTPDCCYKARSLSPSPIFILSVLGQTSFGVSWCLLEWGISKSWIKPSSFGSVGMAGTQNPSRYWGTVPKKGQRARCVEIFEVRMSLLSEVGKCCLSTFYWWGAEVQKNQVIYPKSPRKSVTEQRFEHTSPKV